MLPRAIAAANSAAQTAVVAGPALGGVLIALSPTSVFAACALLWLSAAVIMIGIAMERVVPKRQPVDLKSLFSGLAFIGRQKVVLGAIVVDLFAVLFGGATALLPIFARDIFAAGPLGFGALRAAPAAGALLTALVLTRHPITRRVGQTMFASVAAFGVGTIVLGLSPEFLLAVAALVVVGASDTISVIIRQTLVQLHTPDDDARPRLCGEFHVHLGLEPARHVPRRAVAAAFGTVPAVLLGA